MSKINKLPEEEIKILEQVRKMQQSQAFDQSASVESTSGYESPDRNDLFLTLSNLPSLGKFYKNPVKAQPLKAIDTIIINNVNNENYIERYSEIFSRRILGISPEEMCSVDQDYILIWLRENSFPGYTYKAESYKCNNCQRIVGPTDFYYNQFTFESNADEIDSNSFIVELESGLRVEMRIRRRYHDIMADKYIRDAYTSIGQTVSKEHKEIIKLAAVLNIQGCGDIEERANYIANELSPMELIELIDKLKDRNMRCKIGADVTCPHCRASNNAAFFFRARLFLPNYKAKRSITTTV